MPQLKQRIKRLASKTGKALEKMSTKARSLASRTVRNAKGAVSRLATKIKARRRRAHVSR